MAFSALSFIYDGISSESFDIFLCNMDTGVQKNDGGGNVKIITDKTPKMDYSYCFGVEYEDPLEFTLTFASTTPKTREEISFINNWLIGKPTYRKLQIVQDDMMDIYYNCIMNDFEISSFGNAPFAFSCTVVCDRGWGMKKGYPFEYTVNDNYLELSHMNLSHTNQPTYPIISFTTNSANAKVSIKNVTNNNWETIFQGLSNGEKITLDNQKERIKSSLDLNRLNNFNLHWFELLPGVNKIIIQGNISKVSIQYDYIRKVG